MFKAPFLGLHGVAKMNYFLGRFLSTCHVASTAGCLILRRKPFRCTHNAIITMKRHLQDGEGHFVPNLLCPSPIIETAVYSHVCVYDQMLIKSQLACSPAGD